jgi:hypothetical protein
MDWLGTSNGNAAVIRYLATAVGLAVLITSDPLPAAARGSHGFVHDRFSHGGHRHDELGMREARVGDEPGHGGADQGQRGRRPQDRGNDPYVQATSRDLDRVLNHRIKSICRGC